MANDATLWDTLLILLGLAPEVAEPEIGVLADPNG